MARTQRVVLPDYPHHIVHRGHNKEAVFTSGQERLFYLVNLQAWKEKLKCKIYSYCLMSNHVHLIVDPGATVENLGTLMKAVAGSQTLFFNRRHGRTGTLWEGKYKSSVIDTDNYLLACCRYVELNPVRAGIVDAPEKYHWSSLRYKAGLTEKGFLDDDSLYAGFGRTKKQRQSKYMKWLNSSIPKGEWSAIRRAVQKGRLIGSKEFVREVQERTGLWLEPRERGRPPKGYQ